MTITLYGKPGCHLCESALQVVQRVQKDVSMDLDVRNILIDPIAFERYQHEIPVVLLDGVEIARNRLSEADLRAAISEHHK